jgi:soluble lytic murein transglycosylase-like protein
MRAPSLLAFGFLAMMPLLASASDIYEFVDDRGVSHFSNVPDSAKYRLVLRSADDYKVKSDDRYRLRGSELPVVFDPQQPYGGFIQREAKSNSVDPFLVDAVIAVESNHNPAARSPRGAVGLMQLMPDTAKRYGVADRTHAESNIRGGTRYLRDLLTQFDGDVTLALAAYNAGENAVVRHGNRIPPYAETQDYVPRVLKKYDELRVATAVRKKSPLSLATTPSSAAKHTRS